MPWAERIPGSRRWRGMYRDRAGRKRTAPGGPFTRESDAVLTVLCLLTQCHASDQP